MPLPNNWYHLNAMLADVSTASSVRFVVPQAGFLRKVETTLGGAITGADSVVTVSHNNTALSPTITVANASSAEGDRDSAEYYRGVAAGDWIEVATGGESTGTQQLGITVTLSG
jgi:hypothetical protein